MIPSFFTDTLSELELDFFRRIKVFALRGKRLGRPGDALRGASSNRRSKGGEA
jgi:hypothetical protein